MPETPWLDDACSLVDAYRSGDRNPLDELEACLAAVEASELNAVPFLDSEAARDRAADADVTLPFGGVPIGVKELDQVTGWPNTEASLVFADRTADHDSIMVERLRAAGANLFGQTVASEFGGLNVSVSKLHGVTGNPWDPTRTAGGSSGGSAAAVAGGLAPICTGGDGGGSIRIPAGFCGLFGMKGTFGRIPLGPGAMPGAQTVVVGCLARSVRDVARWYDACSGYDVRDRYSLPATQAWEASLGATELSGLRAVIAPSIGGAIVRPEVEATVREAAEQLAGDAGLKVVDVPVDIPGLGVEWAIANLATLRADLGDLWPECREQLTPELAWGLSFAEEAMNLAVAASVQQKYVEAQARLADVFAEVDLILCATNPDVAYPAHVTLNTRVGAQQVGPENNGALTFPANMGGNPACSIPAGLVDGLPVGLQAIARHHEDALLLDLALVAERERPWPLVAPGAPR